MFVIVELFIRIFGLSNLFETKKEKLRGNVMQFVIDNLLCEKLLRTLNSNEAHIFCLSIFHMITINLNQLDGEFIYRGIYCCKECLKIEDNIQCRVIFVYLHELPIREATQRRAYEVIIYYIFQ